MNILKLIRYQNLLIIIITQLLVFQFLVTDNFFSFKLDVGLYLLILATVLIAAAGNMINDVFDIEIDLVNKPDSVIIEKTIRKEYVLIANILFNLISLTIGIFLDMNLFFIFIAAIALMYLYSFFLKKILFAGNITISILLGLSLFVVWMYKNGEFNFLILFYIFFAIHTGLIREIVKDIVDIEGDKIGNCLTIPVFFGIARTKRIIFIMLVILTLAIISFILYLISNNYIFTAVYTFIFILGLSIIVLLMFRKINTKESYAKLSQALRILMLTGILSMVFLNFQHHI